MWASQQFGSRYWTYNVESYAIDSGGFRGDDSVKKKKQTKTKKIIGSGARRVVYDLGNGFVLKVARSKDGVISNQREVAAFHSLPPDLRNNLGKIIGYEKKYQWVKMRKYQREFPRHIVYARKLGQLKQLFLKHGIIPWDVTSRTGKPNYKNLRIRKNGAIVVIDYGNFRIQR